MQFEQCLEVQGEENVNLKVGLSGLNTTGEIGLLFIHGMGSSGATWHNQITQLSPYFLTMCPDLRGHGMNYIVVEITNFDCVCVPQDHPATVIVLTSSYSSMILSK